MYRAAPWYYASGSLLFLGFAIAVIRDAPATAAITLFVAFVVLWIANGLVLRGDRKIDLGNGARRPRSSFSR